MNHTYLDEYLKQVAMRRVLSEDGKMVDSEELFMLREDDLPRLQEIIRVMYNKLFNIASVDDLAMDLTTELKATAEEALDKVEDIAIEGLQVSDRIRDDLGD